MLHNCKNNITFVCKYSYNNKFLQMNKDFFLNIRLDAEMKAKIEEIQQAKSLEWGIPLKKKDIILYLLNLGLKCEVAKAQALLVENV